MTTNEEARKEFRALYEGTWWKEDLYRYFYPEKIFHLKKFILEIFRGAKGFKKEDVFLFQRLFLSKRKNDSFQYCSLTNSVYPYSEFLELAKTITNDQEKLLKLEFQLMKRALSLIKELQVKHLSL